MNSPCFGCLDLMIRRCAYICSSKLACWLVLLPLLTFVGLPAHAALDDWTDGDDVWSSIQGLHQDAHETGITKTVKKVSKKKILPRRVRPASKRLHSHLVTFDLSETPIVCALLNYIQQTHMSAQSRLSFRMFHNGFGGHILS